MTKKVPDNAIDQFANEDDNWFEKRSNLCQQGLLARQQSVPKWPVRNLLLAAMLFCFYLPAAFTQSTGLEIGKPAPEIKLPDLKGDTVMLSAFRGKVVLIDFWATWCAPCVKEQPELAELYKKYRQPGPGNKKGFEIYGVSLDSKKTSWEAAIKKININWTQVSDLKFWASPVAEIYHIEVLPFNVLIDDNGIVMAKNLHGKELEQALAGLLNKN